MHKKLTSIPVLFSSAFQVLRVRQYAIWFLISGLVFTVISRLFVVLPSFLYLAMQATEQTTLYAILIGISVLFAWYGIVLSFALFLFVSRRIVLGQDIMVKKSLFEAHRVVGRVTVTIALFGLFVFLSLLLLIVPGILVGILCFFAPTISVLGVHTKHPFRQSRALFKGRFWALFIRLALVYVFTIVPTYVLSFVHPIASQAWGITTAFCSFLFTKIYLDAEQTKV